MTQPKILIMPGSNRAGSHNARLAAAAHKQFSKLECEAVRISLRDYPLPIFDADLETQKGVPENAQKLGRLFSTHHGVMIVSPEYNASFTPLLKNAIDWISRVKKDDSGPLSPYRNPVFALAAASPGGFGGIRGLIQLRAVLTELGAQVIAQQAAVGNAASAFDDDDELTNDRARQFLANTCASLVDIARRLKVHV